MSDRKIVALAAVGLVALGVSIYGFRWVSAPFRGKLAAREQIQSGSNRIQAYDHFFNLCAAIQGDEAALEAQAAELDGATGDEADRVRANIAGITAQRARSIAQYNADARKSYTDGQFRASDLPYSIPTDTYRKGVNTSCVA